MKELCLGLVLDRCNRSNSKGRRFRTQRWVEVLVVYLGDRDGRQKRFWVTHDGGRTVVGASGEYPGLSNTKSTGGSFVCTSYFDSSSES